ncbi:Hypothetical predicted protein [Pelobates cultripes]|uniref:Uncharacterized protein n=1 Tax=Pelobates cultripes TaxID=61616 RepID=A0AAD1SYT7_PELCU|nr:Hypothetical predicted protein [Pelobates cultripes]
MAADQDQETGSTGTEQQTQECRADRRSESPSSPPTERDDSAPATKKDIGLLLQEIKQMFDVDLNLMHTETQAVTAQVQASEEDILDLRQEVKSMGDTLKHLQLAITVLQNTLDAMEDRSRRTHIKIRGIPDTVGPSELTLYLRRLTATILPHTHAKKLEFDSHFCINKANCGKGKWSTDGCCREPWRSSAEWSS